MITNVLEVYDFYELCNTSWSGAKDTLQDIMEHSKEDEFLQYLNDILSTYDKGLDRTELNDFIWFDRDVIFEALGIEED